MFLAPYQKNSFHFSDGELPMPDNLNPQSSIGAALLAIGHLYSDATVVSDALSAHLRRCASEPELHRFLSRLQLHLGELRHAVMQPEAYTLEHLRKAIADVVTAADAGLAEPT